MWQKLLRKFTRDIGIDLGTANTVVYVRGEGIVLREPSVVAVDKATRQVMAIGNDAYNMVGRTPGNIVSVRPMKDGVIADFEITEKMIREFIKKAQQTKGLRRPRVLIGVPWGITDVEKRAVLDIGGGTTEVAVISLGGIVTCRSIRTAGNELDEAIISHCRKNYNLLIGERMAERIKMEIGSAYPLDEELTLDVKGRDLLSGLPKTFTLSSYEIRDALAEQVLAIVDTLRMTLEKTPPELSADIMEKGIVMTGGGSLLHGLMQHLMDETGIRISRVEDPLSCVAIGTGKILEDDVLMNRIGATISQR